METSSISQEMLNYFVQLNEKEQESILQMIKTFSGRSKEGFEPVTLQSYNSELEQADNEIEAGKYVPHEEVMKRYLKS